MMHAYFDCFSGISGDMVLGAFVDMGVSPQWLTEMIRSLSIGEVKIVTKDVKKNGIGAKQDQRLGKRSIPRPNLSGYIENNRKRIVWRRG
jgi:hypothetical protein